MNNAAKAVVVLSLLAASAASLPAQQQRPILSPRDSVTLRLDTNVISVNYGRPSMRGRVIMGKLVPWNTVWRTGANEATHLRTNFDMTLGGVPVQKGTYTLWSLPSPDGWKLIINKQTGQWGTKYDERQDLARFDAKVETLPTPVDTFKITLEKTSATGGNLVLAWETVRVSAPFEANSHIRPLSPPDSSSITVGGAALKVNYSAPSVRGRSIWGVVVPYDTIWRTGANAPTRLTVSAPVNFAGTKLAAGTYVIQSVPAEKAMTLLFSTPSDSAVTARATLNAGTTVSAMERFRIWFSRADDTTATFTLGWADRQYSGTVRSQ